MLKLKNLVKAGCIGILIGLAISILVSLSVSSMYLPINPHSAIGNYFLTQGTHLALVQLYCVLIWFVLGLIFGLGNLVFEQDWSLIKSHLSHYLLMLLGFLPISLLAGWIPSRLDMILSIAIEFTVIYLLITLVLYISTKKKVERLNQTLNQRKMS